MTVTDTHCHLYWSSFDGDRTEVLERARAGETRKCRETVRTRDEFFQKEQSAETRR